MTVHAHTKLTYDDYAALPDDGKRYELIEGALLVVPSPVRHHQRVCLHLASAFDAYLEQHQLGEAYHAPFDVVLAPDMVVQPDVIVVLRQNARASTEKNIQGSPDLVVEILSDGTRRRDEIVKRRLYERYGIGEYWVVDHELELVKIYRLNAASQYERVVEMSTETGGVLTTPLLPGFELPINSVFRSVFKPAP